MMMPGEDGMEMSERPLAAGKKKLRPLTKTVSWSEKEKEEPSEPLKPKAKLKPLRRKKESIEEEREDEDAIQAFPESGSEEENNDEDEEDEDEAADDIASPVKSAELSRFGGGGRRGPPPPLCRRNSRYEKKLNEDHQLTQLSFEKWDDNAKFDLI